MASGGTWREAREVALKLRERLLGEDAENAVPAARLVTSALKAAGLRCQPRKPTDPLLSGAHAVLDNEVRAVWVRADAPGPDRQVYISHELAHLHLHHTDHDESGLCHCDAPDFSDADMFLRTGYGPRQRRETEANVFAREFLLPASVARRLFERGADARTIASRVGIPISLVFAQLQEAVGRDPSPQPPPPEGEGEPEAEEFPPISPLPSFSPSPSGGGGWGEGSRLDDSQAVAATAPRGPLLVVAGPGTGKTRTLVARVLYLVNEVGVAPENLLLITFTRKTVEEMRERIAAADPEMARRIAVHTYHSYGLDLLRRHPKAAGLPPTPVLLEKADAVLLLERRAATLGLDALRYLHDPAYPLPDVYDSITRAKDDMLTPADYAARATETGDPRLEDAAKIFATYEAVLRQNGALDYSDLVVRAVRLLEENADVRAAEQAQWQHILVDEYQDINRSGARLIRAIAGAGEGLWVVGDVRQAIYAWRGATPECVSQFERDYPAGKRAHLAVNYRSRKELVRFFGVASTEGPDTWRAARATPDEPPATLALAVAASEAGQADGLAEKMATFYGSGYRWSDMAVLCRTHRQAKAMRLCLSEREIPVARPPAENGPLASPDARRLVSALSRAVDPTGPARHLFPELPPGLPFRGDALEFWNELLWGPPGWARDVTDFESVAYLLGLARSFKERAGVLLGPKDDSRREFLRHLRRIAAAGGGGDPNEENETDAVRVMTVHQAKGLEFPIVFVPNLSAGLFPSRPRPQLLPPLQNMDDDGGSEERRLFFVALTRARDHLVLSRSRGIYSNNRRAEPSPLLNSVEGAPGLRPEEWRFSTANATPSGYPEPADILPPSPTGPKPRVTVDDAGLYLRCPRRYYYERVEELPQGEPPPYVGFRRSVREALAGDDPVTELDYAWDRHGPEETHPFTPFYREAAEEIVAREAGKGKRLRGGGDSSSEGATRRAERVTIGTPRRAARPDLPVLALDLPNGTVTLQPDAVDTLANEYEYQTFRKPPEIGATETELRDESAAYLLQEAARRASPNAPATIHVRFMQNGLSLPLADKQNERVRHVRDYDRALRGLRLKVYNPEPKDPGRDCPECPYYFICPE